MDGTFEQFTGWWGENARLALDTLAMKPAKGIPAWMVHSMDMRFLEEFAGHEPGSYETHPDETYLAFQRRAGACMIDQYLATNPMSMGDHGYESGAGEGATTGADTVVLDGIVIDSPEAVVRHLEEVEFPRLRRAAAETDPADARIVEEMIRGEVDAQKRFGPDILKAPYGHFQSFPGLRYFQYGYVNYFSAYALFPEVMELDFRLQADVSVRRNALSAAAFLQGRLPMVLRLDHDMTDSRGTLAGIRSLERLWFPHFARAVQPLLDAGVRLIWHCDGNVSAMVPRLIEAGVSGFQGFQYEDGVDYEAVCRMTDRDVNPLMIWAGVSVTRTLPFGTKADVVKEMKWLVDHGPKTGLFLGGSSSIVPGTNRENIRTLIEGLHYYRTRGRQSPARRGPVRAG